MLPFQAQPSLRITAVAPHADHGTTTTTHEASATMLRERDLIARVRRTKKPETLPAVVEAATKAPFPAPLSRRRSSHTQKPRDHCQLWIKEPGQHLFYECNFTMFIWVCGILCGVCRETVSTRGEVPGTRQNCDGLCRIAWRYRAG